MVKIVDHGAKVDRWILQAIIKAADLVRVGQLGLSERSLCSNRQVAGCVIDGAILRTIMTVGASIGLVGGEVAGSSHIEKLHLGFPAPCLPSSFDKELDGKLGQFHLDVGSVHRALDASQR